MIRDRLALLGCGVMGEGLLKGFLSAGWEPTSIIVAERSDDRQAFLRKSYSVEVVGSAADAVRAADIVVVAVKPYDLPAALQGLKLSEGQHPLIISVCAGVSISTIEDMIEGAAVVRAMPNVAVKVGHSATGLAAGASATEADLSRAARVLGMVGDVERVSENLLDAVTAIAGSGPAYLFLLAEALVDAGIGCGLSHEVASGLVRHTLLGSALMLSSDDGGEGPVALRLSVTSPGGTTAAALRALEKQGFRSAVMEAVHAAMARSSELGSTLDETLGRSRAG